MKHKIPKWQKGLNKAERDHIRDWAGPTLAAFKRNRAHQIPLEEKADRPGLVPCFLCKSIAKKIGLEGGEQE